MKPLSNEPGRGVLFRVRDKQNPKGPDLKGGLNLDGVEYELARVGARKQARPAVFLDLDIPAARPGDEHRTAGRR